MNQISLTNYFYNKERFSKLQLAIIHFMKRYNKPLLIKDLSEYIGVPYCTVQPRVSELYTKGVVMLHDKIRIGNSTHGRYKLQEV